MGEPERRKDPTSRVSAEGLYAMGEDVRYLRKICDGLCADYGALKHQIETGEALFTKIDRTLYDHGGMITRVVKLETLYASLAEDVKAIRNDIRRVVWIIVTVVIMAVLGLVIVRGGPIKSAGLTDNTAIVTMP